MIDEPLTALSATRDVGANDFAALSGLMLTVLAKAANDGRALVPASFSAEFTAASFAAGPISVEARVERAARTLVFVAGDAHDASGARLAVASGVFKVVG